MQSYCFPISSISSLYIMEDYFQIENDHINMTCETDVKKLNDIDDLQNKKNISYNIKY